MARIAVDMDEVMADALSEQIKRYNVMFGANFDRSHLKGCHLRDLIPHEHHGASYDIVNCEDFFEDLEVMPGSQEVLKRLSRDHEIYIVTAAMEVPASLAPKYRWLQRHFSFIDPLHYVFCGHKHIVEADYLIDDNPRNFRLFKGEGILYDAPHNHHVKGYRRVKDWYEVAELFAVVSAAPAKV